LGMPCGRRCELILCVSCVAGTLRGYGALFGQPAAYVKTLRAMTTVARSGERGGPWAKPACKNHMDFKRHRNRPDSLSGSALIRSRIPRVSHCEYCILKAPCRRVSGVRCDKLSGGLVSRLRSLLLPPTRSLRRHRLQDFCPIHRS